jgi:large subunit ribosomal protein L6
VNLRLAEKYCATFINLGGKKMSRIGKLPIQVPTGVTVTVNDHVVAVKGPKGELTQNVNPDIKISLENGVLQLTRISNERNHRAMHGLYRSLINNMVIGVSTGYKKEMELVGVGYRVTNTGQLIDLSLGYTHNIYIQLPAEVKVETKTERNKNPLIILESADKQLIGQVCAKIRSFRMPEPYKGKGIKFVGEVVRRKSGKSAGK